jgi:uncharacterized repeat protein (TIGR01451 family)
MNEGTVGKTERSRYARGRVLVLVASFALGLVVMPRVSFGMAADGALITNNVSATYGGSGGISIKYTVSYLATANVLVSCPVVSLAKVAIPTVQSAAGVVTFQIWVANTSMQASAFNVVISDKLPDNVTFLGPVTTWWNGVAPATSASSSSNGTVWAASAPLAGQGATYYLRWTLNQLAPGRSGFIQYTVTVL